MVILQLMNRNDRCPVEGSLVSELAESSRPSVRVVQQTESALGLRTNNLERTSRGSNRGRSQACRKNMTARVGTKVVNHQPVSCDEAADRREGLAERGHHKIDFVEKAKELCRAATTRPQDTHSVRLIQHQAGSVFA